MMENLQVLEKNFGGQKFNAVERVKLNSPIKNFSNKFFKHFQLEPAQFEF